MCTCTLKTNKKQDIKEFLLSVEHSVNTLSPFRNTAAACVPCEKWKRRKNPTMQKWCGSGETIKTSSVIEPHAVQMQYANTMLLLLYCCNAGMLCELNNGWMEDRIEGKNVRTTSDISFNVNKKNFVGHHARLMKRRFRENSSFFSVILLLIFLINCKKMASSVKFSLNSKNWWTNLSVN